MDIMLVPRCPTGGPSIVEWYYDAGDSRECSLGDKQFGEKTKVELVKTGGEGESSLSVRKPGVERGSVGNLV